MLKGYNPVYRSVNCHSLSPRLKKSLQVVKIKGKVVICLNKHRPMNIHCMFNSAPRHEDIYGSGGIAPHILILRIA
jgi:hypothetical protein